MKKNYLVKATPVAIAIILSLPVKVYADISVTTVNGVPVVGINKANENGISHNIYSTLNVGSEGLIFNNSTGSVNTVLAGEIAGNSALTSGSASVILNEIQSSNRSTLAGVLEVAGDKAHLIIANPSGLTCSSCGFINTSAVTLTTGTPDMQNGELKGYTVNGGDIRVESLLFNDSPTAILTRSAAINGSVAVSGDLNVVLGSNYVNSNNEVVNTVKSKGSRGSYSLDVSRLGGMYADKITLIGTESGAGVNNAGVIAAGSGGLVLDMQGKLVNTSANIRSNADINMKLAGELNNAGGQISSDKSVNIDTSKNTLDNSGYGIIKGGENIAISSGYLKNDNGKMTSNGLLAISTNGNTLLNTGKGSSVGLTGGVVLLESGFLDNSNGQINGGYVGIKSLNASNRYGTIDAALDMELISDGYTIDNTGGRIRTIDGHIKLDVAKGALINNSAKTADTGSNDTLGIIAGDGGIIIAADSLSNNGRISSSGDIDINSTSSIKNDYGEISSKKSIDIETKTLTNYASSIAAVGDVNITATAKLENYVGALASDTGTLSIKGGLIDSYGGLLLGKDIKISATGAVNNNAGLIVASNDVTIDAKGDLSNNNGNSFSDPYGSYFGMSDQKGGIVGKGSVSLTAKNVYSERSRIIAERGALNILTAGTLSNANSEMSAATGINIEATTLNNDYGNVYSAGDISFATAALSNRSAGSASSGNLTGTIVSDTDLLLNLSNAFENKGHLVGKNKVSVIATKGSVANSNVISSDNEVNIESQADIDNTGTIVAGKTLNLTVKNNVNNYGTLYSYGVMSSTSRTIINMFGLLGAAQGLSTPGSIVNIFGTIAIASK